MIYEYNKGIEQPIYVSVPDTSKGDNAEMFTLKYSRDDRRQARAFDGYLIDIKEGGYDFAGMFKKTICFILSDYENETRNYEFSISKDGFAIVNIMNQLARAAKDGFDFSSKKIYFNSSLSTKLNVVGKRSFEIKIADGRQLFGWYKDLQSLERLGVYGTNRSLDNRIKFIDGAVNFVKNYLDKFGKTEQIEDEPLFDEEPPEIVNRKTKPGQNFENKIMDSLIELNGGAVKEVDADPENYFSKIDNMEDIF